MHFADDLTGVLAVERRLLWSETEDNFAERLASYLDEYSQTGRSFPNPLPPIDLDDLAVVALVQDDADKAIWQGVQVPVKTVNP